MRLQIKTITKQVFTVEVEPTDTVLQLKTVIARDHPFPIESQQLVNSGKILKDEDVLQNLNIVCITIISYLIFITYFSSV